MVEPVHPRGAVLEHAMHAEETALRQNDAIGLLVRQQKVRDGHDGERRDEWCRAIRESQSDRQTQADGHERRRSADAGHQAECPEPPP